MNTAPRFLLAKYVPDLKRMEPRNIGVFLWARGQLRCRFQNEPEFINDLSTYERWTEYWKDEISGKTVTPLRGQPVPITDPNCVDALLTTQKGNYILVDAGELLENVRLRDIDAALDFLFTELVSPTVTPTRKERQQSFSHACNSILAESGVRNLEGFRPKYDVECPVYGVRKHLRFSYGTGVSQPRSLFQRVSIDHDASVHDAALKLHATIEHCLLPRSRCVAFIQSSLIQPSENGAEENRKLLEAICPVVDTDAISDAVDRLRELNVQTSARYA